ncbi:uncharacterized protein LOC117180304 [Belonocnema kinseyi]|uniref:uncharacterized protein LOC117180304 n=1 Tax=Belonocnema kinseyi TaxID=2817044 RepID=UPI00143D1B4D|nr:uncharacterized protein LOC117180304 [Belonocnema kinseyi]
MMRELSSQMFKRGQGRRQLTKEKKPAYPPVRYYLDKSSKLQVLEGYVEFGISNGIILGAIISESLRPIYSDDPEEGRILVLLKNYKTLRAGSTTLEDEATALPTKTVKIKLPFLPKKFESPGQSPVVSEGKPG